MTAIKSATDLKIYDTKKTQNEPEVNTQTNTISAHDRNYYNDSTSMNTNDALQTLYESNLFHRVKYDQVNNCSSNRAQIDRALNGQKGTIMIDSDYDGTKEEMNLADAVAASYDSELDLYIQEELQQFLGDSWSIKKLNAGQEELLAQKGIKIEQVGDRVWSASLVDSEGNVLEDEYGNKGSIIYCDRLVPDGNVQGIEMNFASILDVMGYDCISKADFLGKEGDYEKVLATVEENINKGLYKGSVKTNEIYDVGSSSYGGSVPSTNKDRAITDSYSGEGYEKAIQEAEEQEEEQADVQEETQDGKEILNAYKAEVEAQKKKYLQKANDGSDEDDSQSSLTQSEIKLIENKAKKAIVNKYGQDALNYLPKAA